MMMIMLAGVLFLCLVSCLAVWWFAFKPGPECEGIHLTTRPDGVQVCNPYYPLLPAAGRYLEGYDPKASPDTLYNGVVSRDPAAKVRIVKGGKLVRGYSGPDGDDVITIESTPSGVIVSGKGGNLFR